VRLAIAVTVNICSTQGVRTGWTYVVTLKYSPNVDMVMEGLLQPWTRERQSNGGQRPRIDSQSPSN
jgi:hypothetical protein